MTQTSTPPGRPRGRVTVARIAALLAMVALAPAAAAEQGQQPTLMVQSFKTVGLTPGIGDSVAALLCPQVDRLGLFKVYCPDDVAALLDLEAQKQFLGCEEDSECLAEIGNALGAELVLTGRVAGIGSKASLTLSLLNVLTTAPGRRASLQDKSVDALMGRLGEILEELFPGASGLGVAQELNRCDKIFDTGGDAPRSKSRDWLADSAPRTRPGKVQDLKPPRPDLWYIIQHASIEVQQILESKDPAHASYQRYRKIQQGITDTVRQKQAWLESQRTRDQAIREKLRRTLNCKPLEDRRFSGSEQRDEPRKAYETAMVSLERNVRERWELARKSENDRFDADIAAAEREERKALDQVIEDLTGQCSKQTARPEEGLALALAHKDAARLAFLEALDEFDRQYTLFTDGKIADEPPEPQQDYSKTLASLEQVLAGNPPDTIAASALYLQALMTYETEGNEAALELYAKIVERYPDSPLNSECRFRLAEALFENKERQAEGTAHYEAVAARPGQYQDLAQYKLAWNRYQTGDLAGAVEAFGKVIKLEPSEGQKRVSFLQPRFVRDEIATIATFSWVKGERDKLQALLQRHLGPSEAYLVLEEAAQRVEETGRGKQAMALYERLLELEPHAPVAPSLVRRIIRIAEGHGLADQESRARRRLRERYDPDSPTCGWCLKNRDDASTISMAHRLQADNALELGVQQHKRAQKLREKRRPGRNLHKASRGNPQELYASAAMHYGEFLKRAKTDPRAYEVRFYLAEALYYSGNQADAATQYEQVAEVKGKHRKDAAIGAIFAYRDLLERSYGNKLPWKQGDKMQPAELSRPERDFIAACERVMGTAEVHGTDKASCAYFTANLMAYRGRCDDAQRWFDRAVEAAEREDDKKVFRGAGQEKLETCRKAGDSS